MYVTRCHPWGNLSQSVVSGGGTLWVWPEEREREGGKSVESKIGVFFRRIETKIVHGIFQHTGILTEEYLLFGPYVVEMISHEQWTLQKDGF